MQTARYYYTETGAGAPKGPVSIRELRELAAEGEVTDETRVIQEGGERWRQFRSLDEPTNEIGTGVILHPDWKPPPLKQSTQNDDNSAEEEQTSLGSLLFPIIVTALAIVAVVAAVNWRKLSREVVRTVSRPVEQPTVAIPTPRIEPTPQTQPTVAPAVTVAPPTVAEAPTTTEAPTVAPSVAPIVTGSVQPPSQPPPPEPWLGLRVQSLDSNPAYKNMFKGIQEGLVVQMVEPASRASESELWNADVITRFDGVAVSSADDAQQEVLKRKPGDTIELTVVRKNRTLKIPIKVSERSRSFAGVWEGTDHQFKFGDQSGNSDYRQSDSSPVRLEISDDESRVTSVHPNIPAMPQTNVPNIPDWWYHQDSRTLAWCNDPQYQINLLGDGNTALLKRTPYKDQIDSGPVLKSFMTTSRALLRKKADSGNSASSNVVELRSEGTPKVEAALSSNQTVPGEPVLLRIALSGAARFTMPERIFIDGMDIEPCGVGLPQKDSGIAKPGGAVFEYVILPLKAGRFTIPAQTISTTDQSFETASLELSVRSGRPELPTFRDWLNRDGLGNLLPPRKTAASAPKHESTTEPMIYRRSGRQRLTRATVSAYGFSVLLPVDVFPNAVESLRQSNILMPPNTASPSVTYVPPRPASGFDARYSELGAGASPSDPMKVVHYRARKENSFIVQFAEADHGEYIAAFRKGNSTYMMDVWYEEKNCPFAADTLKAMANSFLANGLR